MTLQPTPPSIARRFAACLYEFVLLFGIYFVSGALIQVLFTLVGQAAPVWLIQIFIFLAFGLYFNYSWTRIGQTLAQKTWHIKVTQVDGVSHLSKKQAWLRYLLSYFGVLPALLILFSQIHGSATLTSDNSGVIYIQVIVFLTLNCLALLGTSLLNPERRTIHEVLSASRTVYTSAHK